MAHPVYLFASISAWLSGAALIAIAVAAPASEATRLANFVIRPTLFLRFRDDHRRPWHARTILAISRLLLLLAGGGVYLLAA